MSEPLPVRKARAIATKLAAMPSDLWRGQLFAGSMTLEEPRVHAEWGFPQYATKAELKAAAKKGLGTGCFGHIVPDYPRLLEKGLFGIIAEAESQRAAIATDDEKAFLDSVIVACQGVIDFAARLSSECDRAALEAGSRFW
jgi:hypothetical protein